MLTFWICSAVVMLVLCGGPFLLLIGRDGSRRQSGGPHMDYAPGDGPNDRCTDPGD